MSCEHCCNLHLDKEPYCIPIQQKGRLCLKCNKRASFNIEGEAKALYCAVHKKDGMIDVISKTCIELGYKTIPTFNIDGEPKALYCAAHKKDGMIDVKSKICIEPKCTKQPVFNTEGEIKGLYC